VLCSSAGGVLDALGQLQRNGKWPFEIAGVITDRECGAESVARSHEMPCHCIEPSAGMDWSDRAAEQLRSWSPDAVLLLILRKVGASIWRDLNCPAWNLHPSLLPAYSGLYALERNFVDARAGAALGHPERMGATIHVVTDQIDAGPIISQRYFTIRDTPTIEQAQHVCYLYKIALVLECICRHIDGTLPTLRDVGDPTPWLEKWKPFRPYEPLHEVMLRFAQPWAVEWLNAQMLKNVERMVGKVVVRI
jgi:phosphoribosylglycinamide formyltransferase-1